MRVAFFSPLPPARSGIADYSAALLEHLPDAVPFREAPASFDPEAFDVCLYQLGNNPFHSFVYDAAIAYQGVIVLHEANLHHLIADVTIRRENWDEYLRLVALEGGAPALADAETWVRTLKRGPNYDLPMLKPVLSRARGVIAHSDAVLHEVRKAGYTGPTAKIPHGAWIEPVDGAPYREKLGVDANAPLFGIFGFLKPYKRIAESLRAFRRVVDEHPRARLILVGEAHADLPLANMIAALDLGSVVRHIDFAPIADFNGYMAACDAVLNLRYPTVGETSGSLQRALGMGKAVLVSEIGAFHEYPDNICLKVPADASEEEHIYQYLLMLAVRPEIGRELGARAKAWVERECSWPGVALRYTDFLKQVIAPQPESLADYILSWTNADTRGYAEQHLTRLAHTLAITPRGGAEDRVLEMGAYMQITPALKTKLGYGEVRGCYFGPPGRVDRKCVTSTDGECFECDIDHFNAECDVFPYPDAHFSTVLCCELIEHLYNDPMHLMIEIHRILKPGGHLVITTPNIVSLRSIAAVMQGLHPMLFPSYIKPNAQGEIDPRHAREYTPRELERLFTDCGFEVTLLETGPFNAEPAPQFGWVEQVLDRYMCTRDLRGDGIYIAGRKTGPVRERYPAWLYS